MLICRTFLLLFIFSVVLSASPLHIAVKNVNEVKVHHLIEEGADVNAVDKTGKTALHYAAAIGRLSVVKYLVEQGADTHLKDQTHKTPLVYAIEKNHIKVIVYLTKRLNIKTSTEQKNIFTAVKNGDIKQVKEDLKSVDLNIVDPDGKTLLHLACEYKQVEIVKMLLELGIDKVTRDHDGRDALNYAKLSGNKKILDLLQDTNATQ